MALTRDVRKDASAGRPQVLNGVIETATALGHTDINYIQSLLETRSLATLAFRWLKRAVFTPPSRKWPKQCILFDNQQAIQAILQRIETWQPDVVYLDSVRSVALAEAIAEKYPELRMICDFDDLMSHRMELTLALGQGMSVGYMGKLLPSFFRTLLAYPAIARRLAAEELRGLRFVELLLCQKVQAVTLLSHLESSILRCKLPPADAEKVHTIVPLYKTIRKIEPPTEPIRFIFLGSDSLLQNKLSITWLLDIWKKQEIIHPLYIFGRQREKYETVANVCFLGFVENLDDIYTANSILIVPSLLGGGIKTKLLQAISHGIIAIGNQTAWEAVAIPENGLAFTEDGLLQCLSHMPEELDHLIEAAEDMQAYLESHHGAVASMRAWNRALFAAKEKD